MSVPSVCPNGPVFICIGRQALTSRRLQARRLPWYQGLSKPLYGCSHCACYSFSEPQVRAGYQMGIKGGETTTIRGRHLPTLEVLPLSMTPHTPLSWVKFMCSICKNKQNTIMQDTKWLKEAHVSTVLRGP